MKIISMYIGRTILTMIALVITLLAAMELFIIFLSQLKDIGVGHYTIGQAFLYALMQMPYQIYLFLPIACLLGALMGLGLLAQNSELIVLQTAGVSLAQIAKMVIKAAVVLLLFAMVIGEGVVPKLLNYSSQHKTHLITNRQSLATRSGVWVRVNKHFIHIDSVISESLLSGVSDYVFDSGQHLVMSRYSKRARFIDNGWQLQDVEQTSFASNDIEHSHVAQLNWDVPLDQKVLIFTKLEPEQMRLQDLYHYIKAQKQNHIAVSSYELNLWQRLLVPLTTCVMMLLAIPFIFGPLRSSSMGARLLAGASVGFVFHIANRFFGPISLALHINPLVAALAPTVLFSLLAMLMIQRRA